MLDLNLGLHAIQIQPCTCGLGQYKVCLLHELLNQFDGPAIHQPRSEKISPIGMSPQFSTTAPEEKSEELNILSHTTYLGDQLKRWLNAEHG